MRLPVRPALVAIGAVVLVSAGVALSTSALEPEGHAVPTARVARGPVDLTAHATGELRPVRVQPIVAPRVGGTLRIVTLKPSGTPVRAGEVVVALDAAEQEYSLEQSRSELLQAEQELIRMEADAAVRAAEDEVALLKARFAVRRAELDARANQFVGAIDARKNELAHEEAKRRLAQLEADLASREDGTRAARELAQEKRTKARLAIERAERDIESMTLVAPFDGLVSVRENRDASGGIFFSGMTLPEYQPGDVTAAGRPIAEVLDVSHMEIRAKVDETDRPRIASGVAAEVTLDAIPGDALPGRVKSVSGLATRGFFSTAGPIRRFDAVFELNRPDVRLHPGLTARIVVNGQRLADVLSVPRQAIFDKEGRSIVYVAEGRTFTAREVTVTYRTDTQVVLEGIEEGTIVALANPEKPGAATTAAAPSPGVMR
jgi:HlyD family secretion protein